MPVGNLFIFSFALSGTHTLSLCVYLQNGYVGLKNSPGTNDSFEVFSKLSLL